MNTNNVEFIGIDPDSGKKMSVTSYWIIMFGFGCFVAGVVIGIGIFLLGAHVS